MVLGRDSRFDLFPFVDFGSRLQRWLGRPVGSPKDDPNATRVHFGISSAKPTSDASSPKGREADSEESGIGIPSLGVRHDGQDMVTAAARMAVVAMEVGLGHRGLRHRQAWAVQGFYISGPSFFSSLMVP
ncbi:hypothetical protein U1Q18_049362 [Sarracenia purpurea var. burkii]